MLTLAAAEQIRGADGAAAAIALCDQALGGPTATAGSTTTEWRAFRAKCLAQAGDWPRALDDLNSCIEADVRERESDHRDDFLCCACRSDPQCVGYCHRRSARRRDCRPGRAGTGPPVEWCIGGCGSTATRCRTSSRRGSAAATRR